MNDYEIVDQFTDEHGRKWFRFANGQVMLLTDSGEYPYPSPPVEILQGPE